MTDSLPFAKYPSRDLDNMSFRIGIDMGRADEVSEIYLHHIGITDAGLHLPVHVEVPAGVSGGKSTQALLLFASTET